MSDALRRGTRTFLDIAFVEAVLQVLMAFGVDFTEAQHAAILVVAPFFISFGKNLLEDNGTIPALLKAPASEGENPIPDPDPEPVDVGDAQALAAAKKATKARVRKAPAKKAAPKKKP